MQEGKLGNVGANLFNAVVPLSAARNDFGKIITPYMRELNSGIGDAVRNRNKASEKLTDAPLPIKYDMLNGQPLQDWNPIHRIINAVTPLSIYGDSDTAGRKLLRESNYDIRRSTFSAPGNIDLKKENKIRSMWQKAQGETEIYIGSRKFKNPEEALNYLATRPDVQESMEDMRRDLRNGKRHYNPTTTYVHNDLIKNVMNQAKNGGWAKIMTDPYVQTVIDKQSGIKKEQRDRKTDQIGGVPEIQQVILPTR